jgi:VanZ family protein
MPPPSRLPLPLKVATLAVCLGVLSWLSQTPMQELPSVDLSDKSEHLIAYAVLATVSLSLFPDRLGRVVLGCIGFGVLMEILQGLMGLGRQCDWRDAVANSIGVLLVSGGFLLVRRLAGRRPA